MQVDSGTKALEGRGPQSVHTRSTEDCGTLKTKSLSIPPSNTCVFRREVMNLVKEKPDAAPAFLRLAFHDAIARDTVTKDGGANGSILWELGRRENYGLRSAVEMLEPIKNSEGPSKLADPKQRPFNLEPSTESRAEVRCFDACLRSINEHARCPCLGAV